MKTLLFLTLTFMMSARADIAFFVAGPSVAFSEWRGSFVVPMTNHVDIAHARELVNKPIQERTCFSFEWARGADGLNRDHLAVGAPLWNWHVSQFLGWPGCSTNNAFGSGWATLVEEMPEVLEARQGHFGLFPGYVLLYELNLTLKLRIEQSADTITLSWNDIAPEYILEAATEPSGGNWFVPTGVPARLTGRSISVPKSQTSLFYRVSAVWGLKR